MSEEFQLALSLLFIGMITVFIILTLVVLGGRLVISLSNKFYVSPAPSSELTSKDDDIPVAILTAVVQHVTDGKGKIDKIKKLD